MARKIGVRFRWQAALILACTIAGCVADGGPRTEGAHGEKRLPSPARATYPTIGLDTGAGMTLGEAVRQIGEGSGGGAVLLSGLEDWPAPDLQIAGAGFVKGLEQLIAGRDCKLQVLPHYVFIYPNGYEQLEALSLDGEIGGRMAELRASFAVGAGTDLYNALALLGNALGVTLIADNLVADAWCGELFLENAPLPAILEALLKSARVPGPSIQIESTDDYIFIRSVQNANKAPACLNAGDLTDAQRERLRAPVRLRLPRDGDAALFKSGSTRLSDALPALSAQLGLEVSADGSMADLPVNAAVLAGVPLETALDLLIWQWPLPEFGYRVTGAGIHFCPR